MDSRRAVGIDIGGTKMAVAAVEAGGRIAARTAIPTEPGKGFPRAVDRLSESIRQVLAQAGWQARDLAGIGIGCAGPLDPPRGLIRNIYTLADWMDCDIVSPLRERFGVPAWLENDADMAAVGECAAGAGRGADPVVMLTFGTGVGGAAIVGGEIYRGVRGEHPELGHVPALPDGPACYCGRAGCLEAVASGTAIGQAGQAAGFADARAVFAASKAGDAAARRIVDRALQGTVAAAWSFFHTFLPQRLILGGGVMDEHFDLFAAALRQALAAVTMPPRGTVEVVRAALGNDAGIVGAAAVAMARAGP
jgi:glucokinase